ncbi:Leishmanolysin-like peptidase [Holothuria leucospilota]|uniref:Leishmanolysin-like peptidase n=1 Tax=Holothuria leucospilota TaxID=206669 RepID=A0A9Q1HCT5_HOLLE|nr:Leishmanolysin-like peptidase [Holothuria leucospilota]
MRYVVVVLIRQTAMLQWPGCRVYHYLAIVYLTLLGPICSSDPLRPEKRSLGAPPINQCAVDDVQITSAGVTVLKYNPPSSRSERASENEAYKPIRVKPFVCTTEIPMQAKEIERVESIAESAISIVRRMLKVYPVEGALVFSRAPGACSQVYLSGVNQNKCAVKNLAYKGEECLDGYLIPDNHLEGLSLWAETGLDPIEEIFPDGEGCPQTDLIVYLKAEHTSYCDGNGIVAYAAHCKLDQFNRPIAGVINFCPEYLEDNLFDEKNMTLVALHELFHILGFSKSLFDKFQECSVCAEGLRCEDRRNVILVDESVDQARLHTPAVSLAAQNHWNCSDVNLGVPLENRAKVGFSSHWESRLMLGSLMAPVVSDPHLTFLDEMTLSVFEDSGWYKVNYEYAEDFLWGKDQGCQFGDKRTCQDSSEFFCNSSWSGCHYLHGDTATCTTDEYLDGCSVFKPEMSCQATNSSGDVNNVSKCFLSNLLPESDNFEPCDLTSHCYITRCNYNFSQYEIRVGSSDWVVCPSGNITLIPGFNGEVHCPPFDLICRNQFSILDIIDQSTFLSTPIQYEITTHSTEIPTFIVIQFNFLDVSISHLGAREAFISSLCHLIPVSRSSVDIIFIYLDQGIFHFTFRNLTLEEIIAYTKTLQSAVQNQQLILHFQNQSFTAYVFNTYSEPLTFTTLLHTTTTTGSSSPPQEVLDVTVTHIMAVFGILMALFVFLIILLACVLKMVKQQAMVAPSPPLDIEVGIHYRIRHNTVEPQNTYQVNQNAKDPVTTCI